MGFTGKHNLGAGTPDEDEVEEMYNEAVVLAAEGQNPYPGSTYVNGVRAALAWVLGEEEEPPLELPGE